VTYSLIAGIARPHPDTFKIKEIFYIADEKDAGVGGRGFFSPHVPPPSHLLAQRIHVFTTGHTLHSHRK
jgi:hypothetical protein